MNRLKSISCTSLMVVFAACSERPISPPPLHASDGQGNLIQQEVTPYPTDECAEGVRGFEKTLYPWIRSKCASCHQDTSGPAVGPAFAVSDPKTSYARVKKLINFASIESSLFVQKGGNSHCIGHGVDCETDYAKLTELTLEWWKQGQKSCPETVSVITQQQTFPMELSIGESKVLRWDLSKTTPPNPDFKDVVFELELQKFSNDSTDGKMSFRVSKPRIASPTHAVHVRGIRFMLGESVVATANQFSEIDRVISPKAFALASGDLLPFPVLSVNSSILILPSREMKLAVSFDKLETAKNPECLQLELFKTKVYSTITSSEICTFCHNSQKPPTPADGPKLCSQNPDWCIIYGSQRLKLDASPEAMCSEVLSRIDFRFPTLSPWIVFPMGGLEHPQIFPRLSKEPAQWMTWIQSEIQAQTKVTFSDIKSKIIDKRCIGCHSVGGNAETVPFETFEQVIKSDRGIVIPGKPNESSFYTLTTIDGVDQMPPKGPRLSVEQKTLIQTWISQGAIETGVKL